MNESYESELSVAGSQAAAGPSTHSAAPSEPASA